VICRPETICILIWPVIPGRQDNNQDIHLDNVGIPQFCILDFDFCILKLAVGQSEFFTKSPKT
jgi:hypothetical protein